MPKRPKRVGLAILEPTGGTWPRFLAFWLAFWFGHFQTGMISKFPGGKKQGQARPFFSLNLYAVLSCQCCLPFGFLAECLPTAKRLIPLSRVVTELVTLFTVSEKPRPSFFVFNCCLSIKARLVFVGLVLICPTWSLPRWILVDWLISNLVFSCNAGAMIFDEPALSFGLNELPILWGFVWAGAIFPVSLFSGNGVVERSSITLIL